MKPQRDDTTAPPTPLFTCTCGATFTNAIALMSHIQTEKGKGNAGHG